MGQDSTRYECPLSARQLVAVVLELRANRGALTSGALDGLEVLESSLASVDSETRSDWELAESLVRR